MWRDPLLFDFSTPPPLVVRRPRQSDVDALPADFDVRWFVWLFHVVTSPELSLFTSCFWPG